jgi:hypothetical protein
MSESLAGRLSRLGSSGYIKVGSRLSGSLATASVAWGPATSEDEPDPDNPAPRRDNPAPRRRKTKTAVPARKTDPTG